jgi:hypothetical protein
MLSRLFGGTSNPPATISVTFTPRPDNEKYRLPYFFPNSEIYLSTQTISGTLTITPNSRTAITHHGIQATVLGQTRIKSDGYLETFFSRAFQISPPSQITSPTDLSFELSDISFPTGSFYGTAFDNRWIVVFEGLKSNITLRNEFPIYVLFVDLPPEENPPNRITFGIEDLLDCEICLDQMEFDVGSCVIGILGFGIVRMRIKKMMISVERIEGFDNGIVSTKVQSIVMEYELLDGEVVRGSRIPMRLYLGGIKLWPEPRKEMNLRVKYLMKFVAICEEGEIIEMPLKFKLRRFEK